MPWFSRKAGDGTKSVSGAHAGIDIGALCDSDVLAAADGKILKVDFQAGKAGYYIKIDHGQYITCYFHLKKGSILVSEGNDVIQGQKIALSGNTGGVVGSVADGQGRKGCHLHFEIRKGKRALNPREYLL